MVQLIKIEYFINIVLLLFIVSCSHDDINTRKFNLPEEPTHQLHKVFELNGPEEGDFFGFFMNLDFLSDGNLIVLETNTTRIIELTSEGELVEILGREGRGPGEFTMIWNFVLTPEDTLHVLERNSQRHHIMSKKNGQWTTIRESVNVPDLYNKEFAFDIPHKILKSKKDGYYAQFKSTVTPHDTTTQLYGFLMETDHDLLPAGDIERLRTVAKPAVYREENRFSNAEGREIQQSFYHYYAENDKMIYIHNNSNKIYSINRIGEEAVIGELPYEHFPIDMEIHRDWFDGMTGYNPKRIELIRSKILDHKPYYQVIQLVGDSLWVQLSREKGDAPNWIITTLEGKILSAFNGPENLELVAIRDNRIYGVNQGMATEPVLVAYKLLSLDR